MTGLGSDAQAASKVEVFREESCRVEEYLKSAATNADNNLFRSAVRRAQQYPHLMAVIEEALEIFGKRVAAVKERLSEAVTGNGASCYAGDNGCPDTRLF